MPPHSSHLLQPLDVGCFGPLKRAYGSYTQEKTRLGIHHIDKPDFLEIYAKAHGQVFKPQNIQSSFSATGIYSFNPQSVLSKLNIILATPTPPSSREGPSTASSTLTTPHTVRQLKQQASSVKKRLRRGSRSPSASLKEALEQIIKGCETALYNTAKLTKENHELRTANKREKQKKSLSKRQMSPNEGRSIQEARDLIAQRNEGSIQESSLVESSASLPLTTSKRAPPKCTICGIRGHNRVRCPNRQEL